MRNSAAKRQAEIRASKREFLLAIAVECGKCAYRSDVVIAMVSGPHLKACCSKCGAYIKFLKESDGVALRKPTEESKGPVSAFFIVTACKTNGKGNICEPVLVTGIRKDADARRTKIRSHGYCSSVDRIPSEKEFRSLRGAK